MRKLMVLIVVCCIMLTSVGCSKTKDSDNGVAKTEGMVKSDTKEDESNQADGLLPSEIIKELETKEYLLRHFKLSYDDYREVHTRYVENDENVDDTMLYPNMRPTNEPITMKDFIGKDIAQSKDYLLGSTVTYEEYEKLLSLDEKFMYNMKISEVYPDYKKDDWFHVYVMVDMQGEDNYQYYRQKYTFKKTGDEYKIIHNPMVWITYFSIRDLEMFTKEEFTKYLYEAPHGDKNYITEIDMKTLLDEESKEENWDSHFKTE